MLYPQPTYTQPQLPKRQIGSSTLPTTNPTVIGDAQGRVPPYGAVAVDVSGAATITIFLWLDAVGAWRNPGSASSAYQKTFTAAGFDYFTAPPGALFYLKSDVAGITAFTDGDPV